MLTFAKMDAPSAKSLFDAMPLDELAGTFQGIGRDSLGTYHVCIKNKKCIHGKRQYCRPCKVGVCIHDRYAASCKHCGNCCVHRRDKRRCRDCGTGLCAHKKWLHHCKLCRLDRLRNLQAAIIANTTTDDTDDEPIEDEDPLLDAKYANIDA